MFREGWAGQNHPALVARDELVELMLETATPQHVSTRLACPDLAIGVELVGEMPGTGFQDRQWLVMRNGQFVQLTEVLYRICEQCDGSHTLDDIATEVSATTDWLVDAAQVQLLIEKKLEPIGLASLDPGAVDRVALELTPVRPLGVQLRTKAVGPRAIEPLTSMLRWLFAPVLMLPILAVIVVAHGWLYFEHGTSSSLLSLVTSPRLLLVVLPVLLIGMAFHELGHASALRYGGGKVRGMGVGLYTVLPAFYTDTTDAYRLGRWARLRTDLGGFYFSLIFALVLIGIYLATGWEVLLVAVLLIDIDVMYQSLPFVRMDGYWALADITGIPDFFSLMAPFLQSIWPIRGTAGTQLPPLRRFTRVVFTLYMLLIVPVLVVLAVLALVRVPWLLTTIWEAANLQLLALAVAADMGDPGGVALSILQIVLLALPGLGTLYFLCSLSLPACKLAYRGVSALVPRRVNN